MNIKSKATNPEEIECTLEMTMTLKEWRNLQDDLGNKYPAWKLSSAINRLIIQMQGKFMEEVEER